MKKKISIRSIVSSAILAIALWTYASLRSDYEVISEFPLEIILPVNTSIENWVPNSVALKIKGTGWQLVNILYVNPSAKSIVNLSKRTIEQGIDSIAATDIKQGFRAPYGIEVVDVQSQVIVARLGSITEKRVPLVPRVSIELHDGFITIGKTIVQPDSVIIRGNTTLLRTINAWYTETENLVDVKENITAQLKVKDSLLNIIEVFPSKIQYEVQVDRMAEITITDIPITILGMPQQSIHSIVPQRISVIVRGGINQIAELTADDFRSTIDYATLQKDISGFVKPTIIEPENVQVLQVVPNAVQHKITRVFSYQ